MLLELIARARRRLLFNIAAAQSAHALNGCLIILMLIAIVGSDALDWVWAAMPPAVILAAGGWNSWRRFPSPYLTAQLVDRRLGLSDTLSTALFYMSERARPCDEEVRSAQREAAIEVANGISAAQAVPVRVPRAAFWSVLFVALAAGLLTMRYSFVGRLDLRAPIAPGLQRIAQIVKNELDAAQKAVAEKLEQLSKREDAALSAKQRPNTPAKAGNRQSPATAVTAQEQQNGADKADGGLMDSEPEPSQGENANGPQDGQTTADGSQNGSGDQQNSGNTSNPQQGSQSSGESNSVLSKISNSMSNLLSALKPQPGKMGQAGGDPGKNNKQSARNSQQSNGKDAGAQNSDSSNGAQGTDPSQGEGNQSAAAGKTSDGEPGKLAGSGAGQNDGDKSLKAAEQRAAMGKISELFGKRSENLTGTAAIEVLSGKQELTTRYEQKSANHRDVRAKAVRDEVPLELQGYVNHYFEQLRGSGVEPRSSEKK